MAQQSKITSRPMTKALGTASILSMAIAGANMANAIQTDFGVTYQADVFNIDGDAYEADGSGTGLANLLRLRADFKDENTGVSLHTSIQLAGDTWSGDDRESSDGYNSDGNESVTLDTGYVQVPVAGTLLRVGRQESNFNNCFLSCDDRRDRISWLVPSSVGTFVALYDRRRDNDDLQTSTNDSDAIFLAYITRLSGLNVGIGYNYYIGHTNEGSFTPLPGLAFHDTHFISPYVSGQITDGLNFATGLNYAFGNDAADGNSAFGDGDLNLGGFTLETDSALSAYANLTGDAGALSWGLQYVGTYDGGLVDPGFDTYSSILNSNPASTQNPTSLVSMGRALGVQDYNEHLVIGKLGFDVTPNLTITGAVGWFSAEIDNGPLDADDTSMIYDLSANYQINESVSTIASLGVMTENEAMFGISGNGNTLSAGAPDDFANEDLMAANLGLRVKF